MLHSQNIVLAERFTEENKAMPAGEKGGRLYDPHSLLLDQSMCRVNALVGHIDGSITNMGEDFALRDSRVTVRIRLCVCMYVCVYASFSFSPFSYPAPFPNSHITPIPPLNSISFNHPLYIITYDTYH